MILSLAIFVLWIFYAAGGVRTLLKVFTIPPDPEPAPDPQPVPVIPAPVISQRPQITPPQLQPAPVPVISQNRQLKPYIHPAKTAEREQLENTAAGMLTLCGCKFDVYSYVRKKSDLELMDIIKDYNMNK